MCPIIFSIICSQLTARHSGRTCWVFRAKCSLASWLARVANTYLLAPFTPFVVGVVPQTNPIVIVKHMLKPHCADGIGRQGPVTIPEGGAISSQGPVTIPEVASSQGPVTIPEVALEFKFSVTCKRIRVEVNREWRCDSANILTDEACGVRTR